jgi:hypothetical protein
VKASGRGLARRWLEEILLMETIGTSFGYACEDIGAARAEELLGSQDAALRGVQGPYRNQRNLSALRVAGYAKEMVAGRWRLTHQGVALDPQGRLLDGQHRLRAVIEADLSQPGITVPMLVTSGIPRDTFAVMDSGRPRSAGSFLEGSHGTARAALARAVLVIVGNGGLVSHATITRGGVSNAEVLAFMEARPEIDEYARRRFVDVNRAMRSGKWASTTRGGLALAGFIAAMGVTGRRFDETKDGYFWRDVNAFVEGQAIGMPAENPLGALFRTPPLKGSAINATALMRGAVTGVKYRLGPKGRVSKTITPTMVGDTHVVWVDGE